MPRKDATKGKGGANRKKKGAGEETEEAEPMDSAEQEELVRKMRAQVAQQVKQTRKQFGIVFCLLAVVLLGAAAWFVYKPWDLTHIARWREIVTEQEVMLWYVISATSFAHAGAMQFGFLRHLRWFAVAMLVATGVAVYWARVFMAHTDLVHWTFLWMPCGPLMGLMLGKYVDHDMRKLEKQVDDLDRSKYDFKKV